MQWDYLFSKYTIICNGLGGKMILKFTQLLA